MDNQEGSSHEVATSVFELKEESELRVEVGWDSEVKIKLKSGIAEIFGSEIPVGREICFSGGDKFAVSNLLSFFYFHFKCTFSFNWILVVGFHMARSSNRSLWNSWSSLRTNRGVSFNSLHLICLGILMYRFFWCLPPFSIPFFIRFLRHQWWFTPMFMRFLTFDETKR